jgi:hypothetical protein
MSDNSATAVYRGTGLTCGGWTAAGNCEPDAEDNDMTAECGHSVGPDGDVVLSGETGEAHPGHNGTAVPNLNITHVSNPARTHGLPANLATNPLSSGRSR